MRVDSESSRMQLEYPVLWQFSVALYPRVKNLCLHWQNAYNANVNVLLALSLAERLRWQIQAKPLQQAIFQLQPLHHHITQQLRGCRQQITAIDLVDTQQQQLKQSLLATELMAEQLEQQQLCKYLRFTAENTADNLSLYQAHLQLPTTATVQSDMFDLRQASKQVPLPAR